MKVLALSGITFAQQSQNEVPQDAYLPVSTENRQTSPAYQFNGNHFFITQVNVAGNGNNIVGDAANEPSIAVSPVDSNKMVVGWRQFNTINSNFRQAGYAYTLDAGQSWTFPGVIQPGVFRSDPVLDTDAEGRFYYNSLASNSAGFSTQVFRSTGDGTWDAGTFAWGGDKQWMTIDKSGGEGHGNIYESWSADFSTPSCPGENFSRSTDEGETYDSCSLSNPDIFWGSLTVGAEGELYAAGITGLVGKSLDAETTSDDPTWDFSIANLGGNTQALLTQSPNPVGLLGQMWIDTDRSGGPTNGNVYLLASVKPFANTDPLDVHFIRSTDGGMSWEEPFRVNDDTSSTAWQWFGTMSVAPNGRIDAVWLDTRDNPGTYLSSLYYSFSMDGGDTWSVNERLSEAFDPYLGWPNQQKLGDYFHMVSDDAGASLAWAATFNGEQDVYFARIYAPQPEPSAAGEAMAASDRFSLKSYPNPFSHSTTISYSVAEASHVVLTLFDRTGLPLSILVDERQAPGPHAIRWDGQDEAGNALPEGVFFLQLKVEKQGTAVHKMVRLK